MIGGEEGEEALPPVLRTLGKEIKASGCPGLVQIVGILAKVIRSPQPEAARQPALAQLERLRVQHGNRATQIAIDSGRCLLAAACESGLSVMQAMDDGELHVHLSAMILADLADASMCPAALLHGIVEEEGKSFQEIHSHRRRAKELIVAAPETRRMAIQLLADPSGASVKTPQVRRIRMSQAELLATALTQ